MKCRVCSKPIPKDHKIVCSYNCFKQYSAKTRRVYLNCKNCDKQYWVKKFDYKKNGSSFCSMKCKSAFGKVKIICANCGKKKIVFKSRLVSKYQHCSKKCFYEHKRKLSLGKLNPNYRNGSRGITRIIRGLEKYRKWKKAVIERDNYICWHCGWKFTFKELEAHHKVRLWQLIDRYPYKKIDVHDDYFYQLANGQTMCKPCHKTTYGKDYDTIE